MRDEGPVIMKLIRNKVLLKWREPRVGWKFDKKHIPWSVWLRRYSRMMVKGIIVMLVLFAAIRLYRGNVNSVADLLSLEALLVGAGAGVFLSVLDWLFLIGPVEIQLCEKNIVIISTGQTSLIQYKDVQRCTIREAELDGHKLDLLEIKYWDGNQCVLEIDPSIPGNTVMDLLQQRGLQVRRA